MIHLIKDIKEVKPFKVKLEFNTGEIKEVNLEENLKQWSKTPGSIYRQLLEPEYFKNVKLNTEIETIYWDNGIDFCPDVLYSMAEE
jgi:hypothetical protein